MLSPLWSRICLDEEGAVTVDWVVLTAFLVAMGVVAGGVVWSNSSNVARKVSEYLGTQSVQPLF